MGYVLWTFALKRLASPEFARSFYVVLLVEGYLGHFYTEVNYKGPQFSCIMRYCSEIWYVTYISQGAQTLLVEKINLTSRNPFSGKLKSCDVHIFKSGPWVGVGLNTNLEDYP